MRHKQAKVPSVTVTFRMAPELSERFYSEIGRSKIPVQVAFSQAVETWVNMRTLAHDYAVPAAQPEEVGE